MAPNKIRFNADELEHIRLESEAVLRGIAPDFEGWPLYVVLSSEVPARGMWDGTSFATPCVDLIFKPYIKSWKGRGPGMFLCTDGLPGIYKVYPELRACSEPSDHAFWKTLMLAHMVDVALHEAAHVLEDVSKWSSTAPSISEEKIRAHAEGFIKLVSEDTKPIPGESRFRMVLPFGRGHGWQFFRFSAHLSHRCINRGFVCHDTNLPYIAHVNGGFYGVSNFNEYLKATEAEAAALDHLSFAELLTTPPSRPFVDLWQSDMRKFIASELCTPDAAAELRRDASQYFPERILI